MNYNYLNISPLSTLRRRSQRKTKQLPEEKKQEKEEPVREYKVGVGTAFIFWLFGGKNAEDTI